MASALLATPRASGPPGGPARLNLNSPQARGLVAVANPGWGPFGTAMRPGGGHIPMTPTTPGSQESVAAPGLGGGRAIRFAAGAARTTHTAADLSAGLPSASGDAFTMMCWVYYFDETDLCTAMQWGEDNTSSTSGEKRAFMQNSGTWGFWGEGVDFSLSVGVLTNVDRWVHLAVTKEAGSAAMVGYGDGIETASGSHSGTLNNTAQNFLLGGGHPSAASAINGYVVDARVYDRVLSDAEIWECFDPATRWELYRQSRFPHLYNTRVAAGGTQHTVSVAGSLTGSGALTNEGRKELAGSLPPAGEVVKQAEQILAGESTGSGALTRSARKQLAGSTTPSGALTRAPAKVLAGSVTAAGTVANTLVALLDLAGSITPTGALTRQARKQLAGSATPTGALVHEVRKALSGSVAATGAVAKAVARTFTGSITGSGALTARLVALLDLAGSLTPSGALTKRANKAAAGSVTATGALTRSTSKAFAGSVTAVGGLAKRIAKTLTGALTGLAGAVSSVIGGQAEPVIVEATLDGSDQIDTTLDGSDLVTAGLDGP